MRRNGTRHFKLRATPQMGRSCVFQADRLIARDHHLSRELLVDFGEIGLVTFHRTQHRLRLSLTRLGHVRILAGGQLCT